MVWVAAGEVAAQRLAAIYLDGVTKGTVPRTGSWI